MTSAHTPQATSGSKGAAISNMIVHTVTEYTGRGPTKARTHLGEDVVTVVLRDTLTKGERSLVADGLQELVLSTRKAFQSTMREDLIRGVEEILGCKVEAFMSDNHVDPDISVEVFVLAPQDAGWQAATARDGEAAG
jgi:uncharacterized protein YbcI